MTDAARSRAEAQLRLRHDEPTVVIPPTRPTLRGVAAAIARSLVALDEFERVFYTGLGIAAIGFAIWIPPLAFIVPGASLATVALILRLRKT